MLIGTTLLIEGAAKDPELAGSIVINFIILFGYLIGGWGLCRSVLVAAKILGEQRGDPAFHEAKMITTRFHGTLPTQFHYFIIQPLVRYCLITSAQFKSRPRDCGYNFLL